MRCGVQYEMNFENILRISGWQQSSIKPNHRALLSTGLRATAQVPGPREREGHEPVEPQVRKGFEFYSKFNGKLFINSNTNTHASLPMCQTLN